MRETAVLAERMNTLWLRSKALFRRRQLDRDLNDELQFHFAMREQKLREQGIPAEEAHYAARRQFGNATEVKEANREMWGFALLETVWRDMCYGLRQMRRNPGFTALAVLTLALGIGASTAIFSVVNGVLLKPLPYPHANRLVALAEKMPPFQDFAISYPDFLDWVKMNHTFEALAAYRHTDMNLTGSGEAERLKVTQVSASFFPLLGVKPVIGRNFSSQEDRRGAAPVVILSGDTWRSTFRAAQNVMGKVLTLDGRDYTVIRRNSEELLFLL